MSGEFGYKDQGVGYEGHAGWEEIDERREAAMDNGLPPVSEIRNLYPRQIASVDQLEPGMVVESVREDNDGEHVETMSVESVGVRLEWNSAKKVYDAVEDDEYAVFAYPYRGSVQLRSRSLADAGVIPYKGGYWNSNYLRIPAKETTEL